MLSRVVSDGIQFDHCFLFPQAECPPQWRGLIGFGVGVRSFKDNDGTRPARFELIGGGIEDTAISEPVPTVLPADARSSRRPHSRFQPNCAWSAAALEQ